MTGRAVLERGSAAVLVTVLAALLVAVAAAAAVVGGMFVGQRRAAAAADLAALAGAEALGRAVAVDAVSLSGGGSACDRARVVADQNGARLLSCDVVGREMQVRVSVAVRGLAGQTWTVAAAARAGPGTEGSPLSAPGGRP